MKTKNKTNKSVGIRRRLPGKAKLGHRADGIYLELLDEIERGIFPPGSRLPTEGDFCRRFNVSNNTLRKALSRLIDQEYVESRQGSGYHVIFKQTEDAPQNIISVMHMGNFDYPRLKMIQDRLFENNHIFSVYSQSQDEEIQWDPIRERQFLLRVKEQRHHALLALCSPREPNNADVLAELDASGVRVVHMEPYCITPPSQNFLMPDYQLAGYIGASTLMIAGYEQLYYVGMSIDGPPCRLQERGFIEALHDQRRSHNCRCPFAKSADNANYFEMPGFGRDADAEERLTEFVKNLGSSTGILCSTEDRAEPVLDFCSRHGIRIPEDVGLITMVVSEDIHQYNEPVSAIGFERLKITDRVVDLACQKAEDFTGVHELVRPKIIHHNTIRT